MRAPADLRDVSLADLTISDASPVALIEAAASAGFGAVGVRVRTATRAPLRHPIAGDAQALRDIRAACASTGVRVFDAEAFVLQRDVEADEYAPYVELAAMLGATHLSCIGDQFSSTSQPMHDEQRVERFAALCDLAARHGLHVGVEFMLYREIHTLGEALALVERAGRANAGVIVDALHLARSGGDPADLAGVPAHRIAYAQLCDAPAASPALADLPREARSDRRYVGEGDLPLAALVRALPEATPLAVETPVAADARATPRERAIASAQKALALLRRCRAA
jgi:sugar phosphate isomerase/epimerase